MRRQLLGVANSSSVERAARPAKTCRCDDIPKLDRLRAVAVLPSRSPGFRLLVEGRQRPDRPKPEVARPMMDGMLFTFPA